MSLCIYMYKDLVTSQKYALSLHDALPICRAEVVQRAARRHDERVAERPAQRAGRLRDLDLRRLDGQDRKSTRLNSSHLVISYAVFCLKKKKIRNAFETINMNVECDRPFIV